MIVVRPRRADHDVAALHRIGFVFAYENGVFRSLTNQARFAPQVAVRLGALAGHENLGVHPDRKLARLDADDGAHAGHAVRSDGDDLPRAHETAIDAVPLPVRRGVALARRRAPVAPQPRTDEMMLGEKAFEVFVGRSNVAHNFHSLALWRDSSHHEEHEG